MKNQKETKVAVRYSIMGFVFLLAALLITGFLGLSDKLSGFLKAINLYWNIWNPASIKSAVTYFGLVIFLFAGCLFIALVVMALIKKKPVFILNAFGLAASMWYVPFLLILAVPQAEEGSMGRVALYTLSGVTIMTAFTILLFVLSLSPLFNAGLNTIRQLGGGKEAVKEEEPVEEEKVEEPKEEKEPVVAGLSEEEVRAIVAEYLNNHVESLHAQKEEPVVVAEEPQEEPVEEEPAEEEPVEEADEAEEEGDDEEEVEEVEEVQADGTVIKIKRKKRVPFENRLRRSVFDLRHKYYDLRDYIKWYGIKNRVSIPGDTFTLKRKKYAFITIVGKHIKLYAAIDPAKYEDSPMPVERAVAKKYEETPCVLRVKSDLSYRRAKQIIDDVMAEAGIAKPEGEEPKETQHPEVEA